MPHKRKPKEVYNPPRLVTILVQKKLNHIQSLPPRLVNIFLPRFLKSEPLALPLLERNLPSSSRQLIRTPALNSPSPSATPFRKLLMLPEPNTSSKVNDGRRKKGKNTSNQARNVNTENNRKEVRTQSDESPILQNNSLPEAEASMLNVVTGSVVPVAGPSGLRGTSEVVHAPSHSELSVKPCGSASAPQENLLVERHYKKNFPPLPKRIGTPKKQPKVLLAQPGTSGQSASKNTSASKSHKNAKNSKNVSCKNAKNFKNVSGSPKVQTTTNTGKSTGAISRSKGNSSEDAKKVLPIQAAGSLNNSIIHLLPPPQPKVFSKTTTTAKHSENVRKLPPTSNSASAENIYKGTPIVNKPRPAQSISSSENVTKLISPFVELGFDKLLPFPSPPPPIPMPPSWSSSSDSQGSSCIGAQFGYSQTNPRYVQCSMNKSCETSPFRRPRSFETASRSLHPGVTRRGPPDRYFSFYDLPAVSEHSETWSFESIPANYQTGSSSNQPATTSVSQSKNIQSGPFETGSSRNSQSRPFCDLPTAAGYSRASLSEGPSRGAPFETETSPFFDLSGTVGHSQIRPFEGGFTLYPTESHYNLLPVTTASQAIYSRSGLFEAGLTQSQFPQPFYEYVGPNETRFSQPGIFHNQSATDIFFHPRPNFDSPATTELFQNAPPQNGPIESGPYRNFQAGSPAPCLSRDGMFNARPHPLGSSKAWPTPIQSFNAGLNHVLFGEKNRFRSGSSRDWNAQSRLFNGASSEPPISQYRPVLSSDLVQGKPRPLSREWSSQTGSFNGASSEPNLSQYRAVPKESKSLSPEWSPQIGFFGGVPSSPDLPQYNPVSAEQLLQLGTFQPVSSQSAASEDLTIQPSSATEMPNHERPGYNRAPGGERKLRAFPVKNSVMYNGRDILDLGSNIGAANNPDKKFYTLFPEK